MTTIQETKLNMYLAVRDFLIPNEALTKDLPNFSANFTFLTEAINNIQLISEQQKVDKKGLAIHKNELRDALINLATDNSRKITAFAKFTGNTLLFNEVKLTASRFSKMTDTAIKDYAQIIYNKGEANIAALTGYGVTPETQKILLETMAAYNDSISRPRVGITERSQATKQLVVLFDKSDESLKNMDLAMEIIRLSQKNFYNGYKTVRKIVVTSSGTLALKAQVTDKTNGAPLKGVIFTFKPADESIAGGNGEIVKKTAEKGKFVIKNMPAGTYQLIINKPGYIDREEKVIVEAGALTDLNVEMERA
jgi:hypothetical protein